MNIHADIFARSLHVFEKNIKGKGRNNMKDCHGQ